MSKVFVFDILNICLSMKLISTLSISGSGDDVVIAIAPDIPENKESVKDSLKSNQ